MMIGDILTKETYTAGAIWCNANNAHIELINNQYVIVENVVDVPTVEEQIEAIDAQYKADKEELYDYFVEFLIEENAEGQQAIKDEMALLDSQYDADIMALSEEGSV